MLRLSSLRQRLLVLFALLAVFPLLALGLLDYARGRRAVIRIVGEQTDAGARQAAALINERITLSESDARLLAENDATRALLESIRDDNAIAQAAATKSAHEFAETFWLQAQRFYRAAEVQAPGGSVVLRVPADTLAERSSSGELPPLTFAIRDGAQVVAQVVLYPRTASLMPDAVRQLAFGRGGAVQVLNAREGTVLYDSRGESARSLSTPLSAASLSTLASLTDTAAGSAGLGAREVVLRDSIPVHRFGGDSVRLTSVAPVAGLPWVVISSAALNEFTVGLAESRYRDLLTVIAAALALAAAFAVLVGRSTRSLEALTRAARAVANGDLQPRLPPTSDDEVGTLTLAFGHMLQRVDATMREIEVSRQLAVLGEFSAQLSHEIRNPLTSIKLNLQELARDVKRGHLRVEAGVPLEVCLHEVQRLDAVVRGVLALARTGHAGRDPVSMHRVIAGIAALQKKALEAQGIELRCNLRADLDVVTADETGMISMLSNLIANAMQAQPAGGRIVVESMRMGNALHITIADDGRGHPAAISESIFKPFVSGSATGTGIGLSLALTVARNHGGTIEVVEPIAQCGGAAFQVTLPLAVSEPHDPALSLQSA